MFGTWHATLPASSPTDASPPARDSRTHRRFGSPRARATAADRWRSSSVDVVMSITNPVSHWLRKDASPIRARGAQRMLATVTDPAVTLAGIRATRARLGDRIHHTPLLSSATAARVAGDAAGVR